MYLYSARMLRLGFKHHRLRDRRIVAIQKHWAQRGDGLPVILRSRRDAPLYLAFTNTFPFLSRPKGRNSGGEELGRGRWETVSPKGR
jgi:hypothetical protein